MGAWSCLEELVLDHCTSLKNLQLSLPRLRALSLRSCAALQTVRAALARRPLHAYSCIVPVKELCQSGCWSGRPCTGCLCDHLLLDTYLACQPVCTVYGPAMPPRLQSTL